MGHTVGDAAARSVEKSNKKEAIKTRTPEQRIHDIRTNAQGILSVPNHEVVFLLEQYDGLQRILGLQSVELKAHTETIATLLGAVKRYENGLSANKPSAEVVEAVDAFETPKFDASTEEPNTR